MGGLIVIIPVLLALVLIVGLFVHAVRADPSGEGHRWLVFVPVLIAAIWIIENLITD
jgi:hypothetical protein